MEEEYIPETSFQFVLNSYDHSIPKARQRSWARSVFLEFQSSRPRDLDIHGTTRHKHELEGAAVFGEAFFGRLLEQGSARSLIKMFDVKKRQYFGNTRMEAEISLLSHGQSDFGTVSLAMWRPLRRDNHQSSLALVRVMMASERVRSVLAGNESVPALAIHLSHRNPARMTNRTYHQRSRTSSSLLPRAADSDLVVLEACEVGYLLNPGGRPVFFLPTVIDHYKELDLDSLLCDRMEVVAISLQDFGA
ncbi:hypothetical protein EDB83DRAFT_2318633 [Lactarius deliciosus]|nr:hypothetical protein EDB83DRAFT_2318633 [Lactarius deliciosus]